MELREGSTKKILKRFVRFYASIVNFHSCSSISGASTHFDLAVADLGRYKMMVTTIEELGLQIEIAAEKLPDHSLYKENPRYCCERFTQDFLGEQVLFTQVEAMLTNHKIARERIKDFESDTEDYDDNPGGGKEALYSFDHLVLTTMNDQFFFRGLYGGCGLHGGRSPS